MTRNEIYAKRNSIGHILNWYKLTDEEKKIHYELDAREMINKFLADGNITGFYDSVNDKLGHCAKQYLNILTRDRLIELVEEQLNDFNNRSVDVVQYTDHYGDTYNIIKWNDEA